MPHDPDSVPDAAAGDTAASATRRATADPDVFLIPDAELPPGFAERLEAPADLPPEPRPAATVVLARDGTRGVEALLLRRPARSRFAADAWVFPGGRVDAADADPALAALCDGPPPAMWGRRLGLADPAEAMSYVLAALREAFEETGVLLARAASGKALAAAAAAEGRAALLAERATLRELAEHSGLRYLTEDFTYLAHWITPEPEPRRYDTRFFLAPLPAGQSADPHRPELVEAAWLAPAKAVERFRTGAMKMLPPTVHTLRRLAGFPTVTEAIAALRDAPVPTILPTMRRHPEGVTIEIG